jgi:hypothetical protein
MVFTLIIIRKLLHGMKGIDSWTCLKTAVNDTATKSDLFVGSFGIDL